MGAHLANGTSAHLRLGHRRARKHHHENKFENGDVNLNPVVQVVDVHLVVRVVGANGDVDSGQDRGGDGRRGGEVEPGDGDCVDGVVGELGPDDKVEDAGGDGEEDDQGEEEGDRTAEAAAAAAAAARLGAIEGVKAASG